MPAELHVVLDACVLANSSVCDLLLRLAETPRLYLPHWTAKILEEVDSTHAKLEWPEYLTKSWRDAADSHFTEAIVEDYECYLPLANNDPKDHHVLAAAICVKAGLIVTFNLRDFDSASLDPFGIKAMHPSEYLITLYEINSGVVVSKLEAMARAANSSTEAIVEKLSKSVLAFALHLADALDW